MKLLIHFVVLGSMLAVLVAMPSGAQVFPVRLDQQQSEPQAAAPAPPSLVLADGGIEFPDGSVQTTAADGGSPAPVPRTGQSDLFATGDDGDLQLGVTWPNPRFTDNGDGTVTDNLTGLIWLDDANCFGTQLWADALAKTNALFDGCPDCGGSDNDCGLADSSVAGQWRFPNVRELQSLVHYGFSAPAVSNIAGTGQWSEGDPFSNVQLGFPNAMYWSSTTYDAASTSAWSVGMTFGFVGNNVKATKLYNVWPVRGGQ